MKAGIFFTGSGPILILFTYPSLDDPGLVEKLKVKGIDKYAAFEVPVDLCRERYGARFPYVAQSLGEKEDLRVLDYNSPHTFYTFKWEEMTGPVKVYSR
ncbi:MAG: hypothetical protein RAO92_08990 [Candidatus Euphemobacter frigidus]|nr:hypothetical protein [Candidatus Euphemobacter frigidus]MDP8276522.1 hypothetical protein [Candidatus Euphemobacter frigidus]